MGESVNRYRSIIIRLTLMVTGILVTAVLVVGSLALLGQQRQLHQALATKATTLVQFMAQVTPLGILSLNFVEMNNNAKKVVLTDDEAVYAIILNEQGIPLVYFFKDTDPSVTGEVRDLVKNRKPLTAIEAMKRAGRIMEVTAPIAAGEKRIGSATLGFSNEKMRRALLRQITLIGAILLVIIGLSIALLRLVLRQILHPVQALTTAATQISTGDLNVVLTGTDRADELGILSRAFESMAGQLRGLIAGLEQREYELRRLTLFQRTILDNAAYGIISAASDGVVTSFNRAAERLLGYTADEVVGKLTPACWHDPEEVARRALEMSEELGETILPGFDLFTACPRRNLPEENEWTFIRKDGTRVPVLLSVTALRDESGRITGFVGLTYNLIERKQAEEALREGEAFLNTLLNAIPIPVFYKDRDGRYLGFNRAFETFFGATRDLLIGKTVFDISPRELAESYRAKDTELFESGGVQQYESQVKNTHGVLRDIIFNKAVFTDSQGTIIGLIGAILDITERKRAEEELKRLNEELEQRVEQRTAELAAKNEELAKLNRVFVGRELRMVELKEKIRELEIKSGERGDQGDRK
jgi:PAS domain S-box-containing protein